MSRDQKFFDMYSLVIGVLAAFSLAIFVAVSKISDMTQGVYVREGAEYQASILERIKPVGEVYLPGEEITAEATTVETPPTPEPVATTMSGPQVYNSSCLVCHGAGIGGAPVLGDTAAWTERLAKGNDAVVLNAINGFTGDSGVMPAKGGNVALSDEEVTAAVDYMIAESQ